MDKRFLLFEQDNVLVDYDEIVRIDGLLERQISARRDGYQTVIELRHGGQAFVSIPFEDVLGLIRSVTEVRS